MCIILITAHSNYLEDIGYYVSPRWHEVLSFSQLTEQYLCQRWAEIWTPVKSEQACHYHSRGKQRSRSLPGWRHWEQTGGYICFGRLKLLWACSPSQNQVSLDLTWAVSQMFLWTLTFFFIFNSPCCFNYISQCWEHHTRSSMFQYYLWEDFSSATSNCLTKKSSLVRVKPELRCVIT